jgi:ADP-ribose pyrophosphatase
VALEFLEVISGIIEAADQGAEGLRRRAAAELEEEAGLAVPPGRVAPLGPPCYLSLGVMAERIYFFRARADLDRLGAARGDGTPLEEGGHGVRCSLTEALDLCRGGQIQDAKTEVALRRLEEALRLERKVGAMRGGMHYTEG